MAWCLIWWFARAYKKYGHTWHRMSLLRPGVIKQHKPNQTKPYIPIPTTFPTAPWSPLPVSPSALPPFPSPPPCCPLPVTQSLLFTSLSPTLYPYLNNMAISPPPSLFPPPYLPFQMVPLLVSASPLPPSPPPSFMSTIPPPSSHSPPCSRPLAAPQHPIPHCLSPHSHLASPIDSN